MTDEVSHPNVGKEVRVVQKGREVRVIFVCENAIVAEKVGRDLVEQLLSGGLTLHVSGKAIGFSEYRK